MDDTNKLLLIIIAILIPPLAVGLKAGIGFSLLLNIILTLLFYIPGLLHALWVIFK
ncbi:MAG: YqaE/Pmp3 family membrane protein [Planctomycetota bacterium]